jgi:hypothetical protein
MVHFFYLTGFLKRLPVVVHRAWSYVTHRRGLRLIVDDSQSAPTGQPDGN